MEDDLENVGLKFEDIHAKVSNQGSYQKGLGWSARRILCCAHT